MNIDIIDIDTVDATTVRIDGVEFAKADCSVSAYGDQHAQIVAGSTTFIVSHGSAVDGRRPRGQAALLFAIQSALGAIVPSVKQMGAKGDGVTDDSAALQAAINAAIAGDLGGIVIPPGDYVLASPITVSASIRIEGDTQNASEFAVRLLCASSGILAERASGADNIVGVHLKNLRIDKTGTAKTAGSYGVKLVGANSNIVCENVEVRYFEKNWWLRGVIGAQFKNVSGRGGTYGLFTESHAALSYDCTNSDFYGCKFTDENAVGVYLGPLTQGFNFFGGDNERNTIGVEFANTAPASSNINFYGTWFEANGLHWKFTQKPLAVQFDGCYIYGGALWSNNASGTIGPTVRACRFTNTVAVDMDIFNGTWEDNSDDGTLSVTATAPNGYYFRKLRGTSFTIDSKTLQNVENIGAGRYMVHAIGTPATSGFSIGSTWIDTNTGKRYIHDGTAFREEPKSITASFTHDFGSVAANSSGNTLQTVTGAALGDAVVLGMSGAPTTGIIFDAKVTAANGVRIYAYNITTGAIDPGEFTFTVRVLKA